ncbi:alanine racemase [Klebsiella aerogenes]|nr:alanine racemase [Klebsiella aerogenes]
MLRKTWRVIAAQRLHTAVHSPEQLAALEQADLPEPVTVWMKLDTGMHRLGVRPEEAEAFLSASEPV